MGPDAQGPFFLVRKPSSRASFSLHRQRGTLPGLESAFESPNVLVAVLLKLSRQTGARSFVRSGAVRYDRPFARYPGKVLI